MNGDTILHIAAQKKDVELARLVCETGAAVNAQNVRHLDIWSQTYFVRMDKYAKTMGGHTRGNDPNLFSLTLAS